MLARAVAGEAEVPFFALTGSSFVELFVGVGASLARAVFADARKRAPSIIFIDEIDAIGQRRGGSVFSNDEREQTLNQLLAEMDGFDPTGGIVVMAATNRPEILDPALLRPGLLLPPSGDPAPQPVERTAILANHAGAATSPPTSTSRRSPCGTPGFSGADLANLINEVAIVAVRHNRDVIVANDLDEARDRILLGPRKSSNACSLPGEQRAVAIHEAGHALVALCSEHADPVAKVTILPAGQSLGVTQQLPKDERHLYSESYLHDSLAIRLEGRAAELLVLGEHQRARPTTSQGRLSWRRGWSGTGVSRFDWGPLGFGSGGPAYLGHQPADGRPYAEGTQLVIDEVAASSPRPERGRTGSSLNVVGPSMPSSTSSSRRRRSPGSNRWTWCAAPLSQVSWSPSAADNATGRLFERHGVTLAGISHGQREPPRSPQPPPIHEGRQHVYASIDEELRAQRNSTVSDTR